MKVIIKQFAETKDNTSFDPKDALTGVAPANDNYAKADNNQIKSVLDTVYIWAGIICVGIIIVSGIYYTISTGDAGKVKRAKDALMYALIGLGVIILAFGITQFVLGGV